MSHCDRCHRRQAICEHAEHWHQDVHRAHMGGDDDADKAEPCMMVVEMHRRHGHDADHREMRQRDGGVRTGACGGLRGGNSVNRHGDQPTATVPISLLFLERELRKCSLPVN